MADSFDADYTHRPTMMLVAGSGAAAAQEAISVADVRLVQTLDWAEAGARSALERSCDILMVELEDASDTILAKLLPTLAALEGKHVIVALAEHQIDPVAAALFGPNVDLLCAPSLGERAAAVGIAGAARLGRRLREPGRDDDAARLRRVNEEVARIAEMLARLARDEGATGGVSDRSLGYRAPPVADAPLPSARAVRGLVRARRMRAEFFDGALFEDPAWDMLLDLYAAKLERTQVSVSSLCIAAAVAPTTALRWIARMTEAGLFERQPDPFDKRRAFLALSLPTREAMQAYFATMSGAGLMVV